MMLSDNLRAATPMAWRSAVVLAAAFAVGGLIVLPLGLPVPSVPETESAHGPAALAASSAKPETLYSAIAAHPLFSPTRRPWEPPAVPVSSEQPPTSLIDYKLVGVVVSDGMRRAMVRSSRNPKAIMLGLGDQLDGWTLREIEAQRLRFTTQGSSYDMNFRKSSEGGQ